jgi:hypothetical protein
VTISVDVLQGIRDRVLPMLQFAAEEYRHRTPEGYPVVVDDVDRGAVGLELDSDHAIYFVQDGDGLFVDFYYRASRNDARSSASRAKFGGLPFDDRRPVAVNVSDQRLRNLIAELQSRWNFQPGVIHITDS